MRNLSEFALIDLCSQHKAFSEYVRGWPPFDILQWMSYFGRVIWYPDFCEFIYHSNVCKLRSIFYFTESELFVVYRRNFKRNDEAKYFELNQKIFNDWQVISPITQAVGRWGEPL
jgi:hypothetical protein